MVAGGPRPARNNDVERPSEARVAPHLLDSSSFDANPTSPPKPVDSPTEVIGTTLGGLYQDDALVLVLFRYHQSRETTTTPEISHVRTARNEAGQGHGLLHGGLYRSRAEEPRCAGPGQDLLQSWTGCRAWGQWIQG